jgi:hypothetical protein
VGGVPWVKGRPPDPPPGLARPPWRRGGAAAGVFIRGRHHCTARHAGHRQICKFLFRTDWPAVAVWLECAGGQRWSGGVSWPGRMKGNRQIWGSIVKPWAVHPLGPLAGDGAHRWTSFSPGRGSSRAGCPCAVSAGGQVAPSSPAPAVGSFAVTRLQPGHNRGQHAIRQIQPIYSFCPCLPRTHHASLWLWVGV